LDIPVPVTTILYDAIVARISVPAILISAESSLYDFVWLKCSIFNLLSCEFFLQVSHEPCVNIYCGCTEYKILFVMLLLLLLLLLFTTIEFSLGGSNPYTSKNKNKYT